jgi:hypothetical protein
VPGASGAEPDLVWIDGTAIDVGQVDASALPDEIAAEDAEPATGLLPASDLGWVDQLDDAALDRAEAWLRGSRG